MSDLLARLEALKKAKGKGEAISAVKSIQGDTSKEVIKVPTKPEVLNKESPIQRRIRLVQQTKQEQAIAAPKSITAKPSLRDILAANNTPKPTPARDYKVELEVCEASNKELHHRLGLLQDLLVKSEASCDLLAKTKEEQACTIAGYMEEVETLGHSNDVIAEKLEGMQEVQTKLNALEEKISQLEWEDNNADS